MKFKDRFFTINFLVFILLFITGMYLTLIQVMGFGFSRIPGDLADSRLNNYFLEHGHLFFSGQLSQYWSAPFMYPEADVINRSDNLLGTLPLYSVFRIIGWSRESAYQGWMILVFALNFLAAAYALKKSTGNLAIASVGAYIFAFSLAVTSSQINHSQVFPRFAVPLVIYWLYCFFRTQKTVYFAGTVFGIAFQFYAGIYLGFMLALCAMAYILIRIIWIKQFLNWIKTLGWKKTASVILLSLLALLSLLPLMYPYYQLSIASGGRPYDQALNSIPHISSYFFTGQGTLFWRFLEDTALDVTNWWDQLLFPGGITIICFILFPIIAYRNRKEAAAKESLYVYLSLLLVLAFTIQYDHGSLYKLIFGIPGFSSMRSVSRIINVELFLFAAIVCFVLYRFNTRLKNSKIFLVLVAFLTVADQYMSGENIGSYSKAESQARITAIKNKLVANNFENYKCFAYIPDDYSISIYNNIDAMLASQDLNIPTVNGYTADCPGEYGDFWQTHSAIALHRWMRFKNTDIWNSKMLLIK